MGRNVHKAIPLEIRWRIPEALPGPGQEVEIAYVRFLDYHTRVTVGRVRVPVERDHQFMLGAKVRAEAEGWAVSINGTVQHAEPLSFLDACYNGWAAFVEALPNLATAMTKTLAAKARYDGWPEDEMEVHLCDRDDGRAGGEAPVDALAGARDEV